MSDIVELIKSRIALDFAGKCHLTDLEALKIVAEFSALRSRLEQAERERDELRAGLEGTKARSVEMFDGLLSKFQASEARAEAAEASLAKAVEVIRPFAKIAQDLIQAAQFYNAQFWYASPSWDGRGSKKVEIYNLVRAEKFIKEIEGNG